VLFEFFWVYTLHAIPIIGEPTVLNLLWIRGYLLNKIGITNEFYTVLVVVS